MEPEIQNADIGAYEHRWSSQERGWVVVGPAGVNPAARRLSAAEAGASILHRTPYPEDRPRHPKPGSRRHAQEAACNTLA